MKKSIKNKKIILIIISVVFISFFYKIVFATWNGLPYSPGTIDNPECLPSQTNCDVLPSVTSELDPLFVASQAFNITGANISNWNTSYGWGDHRNAGYVTGTPWTAMGYVTGTPWTTQGYVTGTPWTGMGYITDGNTGWDNSYGFITSYTEADPLFTTWNKSTGINITESQISDLKSYLTSFTETDPIYISSQAHNITSTDITNLSHLSGTNTGDETNSSIKTKLGVATNSNSGYLSSTDWTTFNNKQPAGSYLTSYTETDPIFLASQAHNITSTDITHLGNLSGTNTGDETNSSIKTKLGITTLSGSNTGDQDLSGLVPYTGGTTNVNLGVHNLTVDTNSLFVDSVNHLVGIGTTGPVNTLDVNGNISTQNSGQVSYYSSGVKRYSMGISGSGGFQFMNVAGNGGLGGKFVLVSSGGAATYTGDMQTGNTVMNGNLTVSGTGDSSIAGNLGIGTTNPLTKLQIKGSGTTTGKILSLIDSSDTERTYFTDNGDIYFVGNDRKIYGNGSYINFYNSMNGGFDFHTLSAAHVSTFDHNVSVTGNLTVGGNFSFTGNLGLASGAQMASGGNYIQLYNGSDASMVFKISHPTVGNYKWLNKDDVQMMQLNRNGNFLLGSTLTPNSLFQVTQSTNGYGTVTTNGTTALVGTNTQFTNTFKVGDTITVSGETVRTIATITDNTNLTVTVSFSTTASGLSYTLAGGDRFAVKGNGYVGIGTTTPAEKLSVVGNGSFSGIITGKNTSIDGNYFATSGTDATFHNKALINAGDYALLQSALGDTYFSAATGRTLYFGINNSPKMVVNATGNVGIGTINPRVKLEIYNNATGTSDLPGGESSRSNALVLKSNPNDANTRPGIIQYGLRTAGSGIAYNINTAYIGSDESNVVRAATMGIYGNVEAISHTIFYTYLDSRTTGSYNSATLKIDNNNSIGIALPTTIRPVATLDVNGGISAGTYAGVTSPTTNGMIISGSVGIGTSSPTYKLEVKGTSTTDGIRAWTGLDLYSVVPPIGLTGTPTTGGSVTAGTHYYFVTYTTALGETSAGNIITVVTDATNNAVDLVIPVSTDTRVTGRRIYRTKINTSSDNEYFLAAISDNTTTTYKDIIADGSLSGLSLQRYRINSTNLGITKDGTRAMFLDSNLTAFGLNAGSYLGQSGYAPVRTTLFGAGAGGNLTTGQANHIFGFAGANVTTGSSNSLFGDLAGYIINTGSLNSIFGSQSGRYLTTGGGNSFYGTSAGNKIVTGSYNTDIGYAANATTASNAIDTNYSNSLGSFTYNTKNNQTVIGADSITPSYANLETIINGDTFIKKETSLGSESLTNPNLTSGTSWTATNDASLATDTSIFTFSGGLASTLTQTNANLAVKTNGSRWYKFVYTVSAVTGTPTATITTASSLVATNLYVGAAGTYTVYFQSAIVPTDFIITSTLTSGQAFTLDTFSLKEVIGGNLGVNGNLNLSNTTSSNTGVIYSGSDRILHTYNSSNIFLGKLAGNFTLIGTQNMGFGTQVFESLTSGFDNVAMGFRALQKVTDGARNFGLGTETLQNTTTGSSNIGIGNQAFRLNISGSSNVGIGSGVGYYTTGGANTFIGYAAGGGSAATGSYNIFIGQSAGYYESGSSKLIIDDRLRPDEATGRTSALVYGIFDDTPANQILSLGGGGKVGIGTTTPASLLTLSNINPIITFSETDSGVNNYSAQVNANVFSIGRDSIKTFNIVGGNIGIGTTTPGTKLEIGSYDLGDGLAGPIITLGRNTNATNSAAGSINFYDKAGLSGYVWQDAAGNMRINNSAPTTTNDTAGIVIGAQTSERTTKQDIEDYTDYTNALSMIVNAPLHTFRYIREVSGYGPYSPLAKTHIGYIADEVDPMFMSGNVIDQVSVNGLLMASIKELNLTLQDIAIPVDNANKSFIERFYEKMISWLGSSDNGLEKICVKKSDGSEFCVNGDQLEQAVNGLSNTSTTPAPEVITPEPTVTPPEPEKVDVSPVVTPEPIPATPTDQTITTEPVVSSDSTKI